MGGSPNQLGQFLKPVARRYISGRPSINSLGAVIEGSCDHYSSVQATKLPQHSLGRVEDQFDAAAAVPGDRESRPDHKRPDLGGRDAGRDCLVSAWELRKGSKPEHGRLSYSSLISSIVARCRWAASPRRRNRSQPGARCMDRSPPATQSPARALGRRSIEDRPTRLGPLSTEVQRIGMPAIP